MVKQQFSYVIGGAYAFFLCVQYLAFYLVLALQKKREQLTLKFTYILVTAFFILLFSIFGAISSLLPSGIWKEVFFHLRFLMSLIALNSFVMLLRYYLVSLKDMTFVETDDYKDSTRHYLIGFNAISIGIGILAILSAFIKIPSFSLDRLTLVVAIVFVIGVLIVEPLEFLKIFRKEKGKLNQFSRFRFLTVLWSGEVSFLFLVVELLGLLLHSAVLTDGYSLFMYGSVALSMGLSLNLIFEHMELLSTVNESNLKLNELNRSMMDDVRTAQSLQLSLLPIEKHREIHKILDIEVSYMPMQSVGGDYYDFYRLDEKKVLILIGDASGHGVYAAMIWAMLKVEVEELIDQNLFGELGSAFNVLNRKITRLLENTYSYATLFACIVDVKDHSFSYITAGHTDQLFFNSVKNKAESLRNRNPIVGTFASAVYHHDKVSGKVGDVIMMFTDGIVEATNSAGEQLQTDHLAGILEQACREDRSQSLVVLRKVLTEVEDFTEEGFVQQDDRTVIVIRL